MIGPIPEILVSLAGTYGLGVLFVVFVLEGTMIGKVVPTRALFVMVVLAIGTTWAGLLMAAAIAVIGATIGQLLLFGAIKYANWSPSWAARSESDLMDRWGVVAVGVTNAVPIIRGTLTVPSAMTGASAAKFSVSSFVGSAVYVGLLSIVATSFGSAIGLA